jgi:hypothetical protein
MANKVFANGREIACKAASGKTICAFPDVCFTPPETPVTPPGVPIPYPNTGMANDTTSGSKKVKISKKEVMLKNKSHFKKSMGDEAGVAAKKGVVTSTNRGKVYFNVWSMDVKFEGENIVRHFDLTTNNHMSMPGDTPPWIYVDTMAVAVELSDDCKKLEEYSEESRKELPKSLRNQSTTVTSGMLSIPGQGALPLRAFSRKLAGRKYTKKIFGSWAQGIKPGGNSNVPGFRYAETLTKRGKVWMPKSSHAEARIIEDVFSAAKKRSGGMPPGTKLTLRINWLSKDGVATTPCPHCQQLIKAACANGVEVEVCGHPEHSCKPPPRSK